VVAVLHIQANAIRPIDDALGRAHHTNITGFEVLARLSEMPHGASVRYLSDQVVVSPSRVSCVADDFVARGLLERRMNPAAASGCRTAAGQLHLQSSLALA
jgi:DNA-binding MarR family transcriptional regulator